MKQRKRRNQRQMLNPVASGVLVGFYLFAGVLLIGILGALTFALFKLNALLEAQLPRIETTLEKANHLLTAGTEKVNSLSDKTEEILTQGEQVAETVHEKVEQTAGAVQRTVNAPIIGLNSFAAGLSRGLKTFAALQNQQALNSFQTHDASSKTAVPVAIPATHND